MAVGQVWLCGGMILGRRRGAALPQAMLSMAVGQEVPIVQNRCHPSFAALVLGLIFVGVGPKS